MQDHLTTVAPCAGQGELAEFHLPWNGIDTPLTGGIIQPNASVTTATESINATKKELAQLTQTLATYKTN